VIFEIMKNIYKKLGEELRFKSKTEKAYKQYEKGNFKQESVTNFLEEIEKW
jgi:hypothetical protein